jgi:hypothetical protein
MKIKMTQKSSKIFLVPDLLVKIIFSGRHLANTRVNVYGTMKVLVILFSFALEDFSKFIVIANQVQFRNLQSYFWFLAF